MNQSFVVPPGYVSPPSSLLPPGYASTPSSVYPYGPQPPPVKGGIGTAALVVVGVLLLAVLGLLGYLVFKMNEKPAAPPPAVKGASSSTNSSAPASQSTAPADKTAKPASATDSTPAPKPAAKVTGELSLSGMQAGLPRPRTIPTDRDAVYPANRPVPAGENELSRVSGASAGESCKSENDRGRLRLVRDGQRNALPRQRHGGFPRLQTGMFEQRLSAGGNEVRFAQWAVPESHHSLLGMSGKPAAKRQSARHVAGCVQLLFTKPGDALQIADRFVVSLKTTSVIRRMWFLAVVSPMTSVSFRFYIII